MISAHEKSLHLERLLVRVPLLATCTLGLAFGLSTFLIVLRNNLRETGVSWDAVVLFIVITGSVALLILMASAVVGLVIGLVLRSAFRHWNFRRA